MSDLVHVVPTGYSITDAANLPAPPPLNSVVPKTIPVGDPVGVSVGGGNGQTFTTNYQPAPNKPMSGGRAAVAVVLVFIFAGTAMYYRYQQRIDAFFGESGKRPVVVKARPPAKMSKLDQEQGRPTREAPLPTIIKSNQPSQLYYGP